MVWVEGDGMSFVWECVVCCICVYPTSPSSPSALRSGAGSTMASTITTHRGPALLCLCQRGWCSTPEVCQIVNGFFLYFAILMGVRVHSSCFAYSEAPDCSLPGALDLQGSLKFP